MDNLLVVCSRFPHGHDPISGIFILSQLKELKKKFKKVVVISIIPKVPVIFPSIQPKKRSNDTLARNYKIGNIEIVYFSPILLPIKQIKVVQINKISKKIIKLLKKKNFIPTIIHGHFIWPSAFVIENLKKEYKVPCLVTGHGYDVYDLPFRHDYWLKKIQQVLKNVNMIITVSNKNKDILIKKIKVNKKKINVIQNGFDENIFFPKQKQDALKDLGLKPNFRILLSIGNLNKRKDFSNLIKAYNLVRNRIKNTQLYIIGDGPEKKNLSAEIKKNGLEKKLHLLGKQNQATINNWINASEFVVISSFSEGMPTILFEILGCGKPIVSTNVGGIPEIINNEKLGLLVPPKDPKELANMIITALNTNFKKEYILEYSQKFKWSEISKRIYNLYLPNNR